MAKDRLHNVQSALEAAANAMELNLQKHEYRHWLTYFFELLESQLGESAIQAAQEVLRQRQELGRWPTSSSGGS